MRFLFDSILRIAIAPWRWLTQRRRLALLLIPFGLTATPAEASDEGALWTPVLLKQADRTRNDLELTLRARRILVEDPALARYEIMVRIDDRIAELSGPVPSMDIAQRAEADLRGLLGLSGIRNRLTIAGSSSQTTAAVDQARVDWRISQMDSPVTPSELTKSSLASRMAEMPMEPSFNWRPAHQFGNSIAFPIPFLPEGLSRPPEVGEQLRESSTTSRENLRIGKAEIITSRFESKQGTEVFVLPAIDLRHAEDRAQPGSSGTGSGRSPRYLFLGF